MAGSVERYVLRDGSVRWSVRWRGPDGSGGVRQFRERGFSSRREASRVLRDRLSQPVPVPVPVVGPVFSGFAEEWLLRHSGRVRPSSIRVYRAVLEHHVLPVLGDLPLGEVSAGAVAGVYSRMAAGGLSVASQRLAHAVVVGVLGEAVRFGVIPANPALQVGPPRVPAGVPLVEGWDRQVLGFLLDGTRGDRFAVLWRVAAMSGARRGELLGLTWDRVDPGGGLRIDRQLLDAKGGVPVFGPPKTARGVRSIDLDGDTAQVLASHRASQAADRLAAGAGWSDHGLVFSRPDGGALQGGTVVKEWRGSLARLGLPPLRFHGLRHLHATLLLEVGVPAHVVSRRLGHSGVGFTLSTYAASLPHQDRDAVEALAALV